MNVLDKLGIIYAMLDCGGRACSNCMAKGKCATENRHQFINSFVEDVIALIKERDEALAKLEALNNQH